MCVRQDERMRLGLWGKHIFPRISLLVEAVGTARDAQQRCGRCFLSLRRHGDGRVGCGLSGALQPRTPPPFLRRHSWEEGRDQACFCDPPLLRTQHSDFPSTTAWGAVIRSPSQQVLEDGQRLHRQMGGNIPSRGSIRAKECSSALGNGEQLQRVPWKMSVL